MALSLWFKKLPAFRLLKPVISALVLNTKDLLRGKFPQSSVSKALRQRTAFANISRNIRTAIQSQPEALIFAHDDCVEYDPRRLALFSDGALSPEGAATAVSWKFGSGQFDWRSEYYIHTVTPSVQTSLLELVGVVEALCIAARLCEASKTYLTSYRTVVIYTDSHYAVHCFIDSKTLEKLYTTQSPPLDLEKLTATIEMLKQANVELELRWCPAHSGIAGNMISDSVCTAARGGLLPATAFLGDSPVFAKIVNDASKRREIVGSPRGLRLMVSKQLSSDSARWADKEWRERRLLRMRLKKERAALNEANRVKNEQRRLFKIRVEARRKKKFKTDGWT